MNKKILITGGMGFIGSHLAKKYLESKNDIYILSRSYNKKNNIFNIENKINLIIKDVRKINEDDVKNKDYIFHLAGTVDNYAIKEDKPYKDIKINCNGTIALLEACKKYNPKAKIIFGSTFFVNGNADKLPVNADSPCNPLGLYPATKLAAEHFCRIYHNVFNLDVIIARFTNVFGPFEDGNNKKKAGFNFMINQAVKGKEIQLYNNGDFVRDYIYVDDVADACMTLAEKGETNKVYYVGRGEFTKFRELINIVREQIPNTKVKVITPPDFHKNVGIVDFVCDNSGLKKIGWTPKTSLEDGIKRTIEFYKK
ncbi:MAG: NAD-dependent epimerase/dehydratase [archaeon GW2011_AR19]|nr:MAG: NAD-dependent epimerase/dehydratase [archaeon GW2011_AR19]